MPTAIAGVHGTVYQSTVNSDKSAEVKVYDGEVAVSGVQPPTKAPAPGKPQEVKGPHEIAGPKEVSMEEWTYILKALQQINIRPDGSATKPFRFSIEEDLNDWVRWNQQLDEAIEHR